MQAEARSASDIYSRQLARQQLPPLSCQGGIQSHGGCQPGRIGPIQGCGHALLEDPGHHWSSIKATTPVYTPAAAAAAGAGVAAAPEPVLEQQVPWRNQRKRLHSLHATSDSHSCRPAPVPPPPPAAAAAAGAGAGGAGGAAANCLLGAPPAKRQRGAGSAPQQQDMGENPHKQQLPHASADTSSEALPEPTLVLKSLESLTAVESLQAPQANPREQQTSQQQQQLQQQLDEDGGQRAGALSPLPVALPPPAGSLNDLASSARLWCVTRERAEVAQHAVPQVGNDPRLDKSCLARSKRRGLPTSSYRGVTQHRRTRRFEAHIWSNGKQVYLGGFHTDKEAAMAHDLTSIRFFGGRLAVTNFGPGTYQAELAALDAKAERARNRGTAVEGAQLLQSYDQVQAWRQVLRGNNAAAAATATVTSSQADTSSPENSQPTNTGDDPQQAEEPQGLEQQLRPTPIVKARTAQRKKTQPLVSMAQQLAGAPASEDPAKPSPSQPTSMPDMSGVASPPESSQPTNPSGASQQGAAPFAVTGGRHQRRATPKLRGAAGASTSQIVAGDPTGSTLGWGVRRQRSSRVHWPSGCSPHLISSLAEQNGQAALRAAGLTDRYRQRLAAVADTSAGAEVRTGEDDGEEALEAAMQPLQAAAAAAAAAAAVKLQQQIKLLKEQQEQQEDEWSDDTDMDTVAAAGCSSVPSPASAPPFDTEAVAIEAAPPAAAASLLVEAVPAASEAEVSHSSQQAPGDGAVFQAMNRVLLQLEAHSAGLGTCLNDLTTVWSQAWQLVAAAEEKAEAAAAAAPLSLQALADCALAIAGGKQDALPGHAAAAAAAAMSAGPAAVNPQHRRLSQQRCMALHQLINRCLQQQEDAEQKLCHMRDMVAPFLPYAAAGQSIPESAGDVAVSVLQLHVLHHHHTGVLWTIFHTMKQLQAALTAVLASVQASAQRLGSWGPLGEVKGGRLGVVVGELSEQSWQNLEATWSHLASSMKLVGLEPASRR